MNTIAEIKAYRDNVRKYFPKCDWGRSPRRLKPRFHVITQYTGGPVLGFHTDLVTAWRIASGNATALCFTCEKCGHASLPK